MAHSLRSFTTAALVLLLLPSRSEAVKFVYGMNKKDFGKMSVSHPPEALLKGTTIRLQSKPLIPYPQAEVLGVKLEEALASEFGKPATGAPDMTLVYSVLKFEPVTTKTSVQNETRTVKTGEKTTMVFGQPVKTPIFGEKVVPVQYFEAHGALQLQVTVTDSKGIVLDLFSPTKDLRVKLEVSVNNESKLGGSTLPTTQSEAGDLLDQVVGVVQARYTRTKKTEEVQLAVDDELRAGNLLAASGNWQGALDSWKAANMKKNGSDRLFNMAAANEALAYTAYDNSRDPATTEPLFQQALALYTEAGKEDPKEKYIKLASSRVASARETFERVKSQEIAREAEVANAIREAQQKQLALEETKRKDEEELRAINTAKPDSKDEAEFRSTIKMRLKGYTERPPDSVESDLESMGAKVYKLDSKASRRVVLQEVNRRVNLTASREEYKSTFKDFAADKVIDKDEREQLRKMSARLGLSEDETKVIEEPFGAKDTSPVRASRTTPPARKAAPRPANNGAPGASPTASPTPAISGPGAKQP